MKIGQIEPNKYKVSQCITQIAARQDVRVIVEIGTWNGLGSTRCVLQGLANKEDYLFHTYECWPEMYKEAVENNKEYISDKVVFLLGKLIHENFLTNWDREPITPTQNGWLMQDIERMKQVPFILDTVPEKIDLLILDGGEFSTYREWNLLKDRTRYFVLDDTTTLKCTKIREEILSQPDKYKVLSEDLHERNGYLVGEVL